LDRPRDPEVPRAVEPGHLGLIEGLCGSQDLRDVPPHVVEDLVEEVERARSPRVGTGWVMGGVERDGGPPAPVGHRVGADPDLEAGMRLKDHIQPVLQAAALRPLAGGLGLEPSELRSLDPDLEGEVIHPKHLTEGTGLCS